MHPNPLDETRVTSLIDIEQKSHEILQCFDNSIQHIHQCSDFIQVQAAVIQHLKEAANYINRCTHSISTLHPQLNFPLFEFDSLIKTLKADSSITFQYPIDQIEFQLRDLSAVIDQWVFIIRDCPELETKPHIRLLAKAMCEIFEIQHFYIYPYHKALIPEYLKKSDFNRHFDFPIK